MGSSKATPPNRRKRSLAQCCLVLVLCNLSSVIGFSTRRRKGSSPVPRTFVPSWSSTATTSISSRCSSAQHLHPLRDADMMEMMAGGERYEMVPLPDSMLDTTLFVGNLCEFCKDGDLSALFAQASHLQSLPAMVARKVNNDSLRYGFVCFQTVEEKEKAILRFHQTTFMGRQIKVEEIRDHPKKGRVKVPGRMVEYVVGSVKRTPQKGRINTMRRVARMEEGIPSNTSNNNNNNNGGSTTINNASSSKKQPQQQRQRGAGSGMAPGKAHLRLSGPQQAELLRAARRGFVTLEGTGFRRGRSTNALACAHRELCDEQSQPQMVLCKASGGRALDCLIVDLSPLRFFVQENTGGTVVSEEPWRIWKEQILQAAERAGMELRTDYVQDNCYTLTMPNESNCNKNKNGKVDENTKGTALKMEEKMEEKMVLVTKTLSDDETDGSSTWDYQVEPMTQKRANKLSMGIEALDETETPATLSVLTDTVAWSSEPIDRLPSLSLGVFEGERSAAKAMARELAELWGTAHEPLDLLSDFQGTRQEKGSSKKNGGSRSQKSKRSRKETHRRNRRSDQQYLNMYLR